jgi:hypothetical protein
VGVLQNLDTVFSFISKERAFSRNSGIAITTYFSSFIIQNFCDGPEILDHWFPSYRDAVHVPKLLDEVFGILAKFWTIGFDPIEMLRTFQNFRFGTITKESGRSRKSGHGVFVHIERNSNFQ